MLMTLLIILLAIILMQIWAYDNPLHRDSWLYTFARNTASALPIRLYPFVHLALAFVIALVVSLFIAWVASFSKFLAFPLVVIVLIFSCGRYNFTDTLHDYFIALKHGDEDSKKEIFSKLFQATPAAATQESLSDSDSASVNEAIALPENADEKVFDELAVRGFERYFTAIFWFFVGGVFLTLLYRLVALFAEFEAGQHQHGESDKPVIDTTMTQHAQRLMAWPASRLLHLSMLLAGNFRKAYDDVLESLASSRPAFQTVPAIAREAGEVGEVQPDDFIGLKTLLKICLGIWLALIALIVIL